MTSLAACQAIGTLDLPAGYLLAPEGPGVAESLYALAVGAGIGIPALPWFDAALAGDVTTAATMLEALRESDAVAAYNHAVLVGSAEDWDAVRRSVAPLDGSTGEALRAMTATARFTMGLQDDPPDIPEHSVPGAVLAVVHSARASARLELGDTAGALVELTAGAEASATDSPVLAATLLGTRADLLRDSVADFTASYADSDRALSLLPDTAPAELRADLQVTRALAAQGLSGERRGLLVQAVNDLQAALTVFRKDTHPEMYALANQQLALAYLAMPMTDAGDSLRLGIAVNCLREALTIYRPDTHAAAWATAQVNLANALIYLPSVHTGDNLVEAVELYEEVLVARPADVDPEGRARVLANQGNALAHLGIRDHAQAKLAEARSLFVEVGAHDAVEAIDELLAQVEVE